MNRKENGKLMVVDFRWKFLYDCKLVLYDCILLLYVCKLLSYDCKLVLLICLIDWKIGIIE